MFWAILFAIACAITPMFSTTPLGEFSVPRLFFGFVGFLLCEYLLKYLLEKISVDKKLAFLRNNDYKLGNKAWFIFAFVLTLFVGSFYFIAFYPGASSFDTGEILAFGMSVANQHPWLYCVSILGLRDLVVSLGFSETIAFAVICFLQMLVACLVTAHAIVYLKKQEIPRVFLVLIILFFALTPVINIYMVTPLKDVLFSYLIMEWVIFLHKIYKKPEETLSKKSSHFRAAALIFFLLLRNNGLIVALFTLIILAFVYRQYYKKILVYILMIFITFGISKGVEASLSIDHLFKETVGIPLQQIAAVVCAEDGKMSAMDYAFTDRILDHDYIKENYNPYSTDSIKWGDSPIDDKYLNSHKLDFIKTWLSLMVKNPGTYLKAHLYNTYSFWAVKAIDKKDDHSHAYVYDMSYSDTIWGMSEDNHMLFGNNYFLNSLHYKLFFFLVKRIRYAHIAGTLFWAFVLLIITLIKKAGRKALIPSLPILSCYLTILLAAPDAFTYRYALYVALSLPFFLGMLILEFCKMEPKKH